MTVFSIRNIPQVIQDLLNNAQDIIYYIQIHPTITFLYINDAVTRITGYTPQEHYDNPNLGFEIVHPEDREILQQLMNSDDGGFNRPIELRWEKKTGKTIWTEQINTPIFDEQNKLVGIVGTARDITRRKLAEDQIENLQKLLPICGYCKKIRNQEGIWQEMNEFLEDHSKSRISHSICPECAEMLEKQIKSE